MVVTFALVSFPLDTINSNLPVYRLALIRKLLARASFHFQNFSHPNKPFGAPLGGLIVHYISSLLVIALSPSGDAYLFILEVKGYPGAISSRRFDWIAMATI